MESSLSRREAPSRVVPMSLRSRAGTNLDQGSYIWVHRSRLGLVGWLLGKKTMAHARRAAPLHLLCFSPLQ